MTNQKKFLEKIKNNLIFLKPGEIVSINNLNEKKIYFNSKNECENKNSTKYRTTPVNINVESSFQNKKKITWKIYPKFLNAAFGPFVSIFLLIIFISSQILIFTCDKWLFKLTSYDNEYKFFNGSKLNKTSGNFLDLRNHHIIYYTLVFSVFLIFSLRTIFYYYCCIQGSKKLYKNMLRGVLNTHFYFFHLNPIGNFIINFEFYVC